MQNNLTKSGLKNKIENLEKYFLKYKNNNFKRDFKVIKDYLNEDYKVAIVGNMSAGKSTFINALFHKDILPAYDEATTDSPIYIYSDSSPNTENKLDVFFKNGKVLEIKTDIEKEIKLFANKDETLEREEKEGKNLEQYKNVEKIDLYYPFPNIQASSIDGFKVTFIDTPGPNANGEYGEEHKLKTQKILQDANLVLFLFDFSHIDDFRKDPNENDKQGLWNTIKARYEAKEELDFEIYFLINKIDKAMDSNFSEIKAEDISDEEFLDLKQKAWMKNENIAIEKVKNSAKEHGISNQQVYPVSSMYQLYYKNNKNTFHNEKKLKRFKEDMEEIFLDSNFEQEFINYLGFEKFEKDLNNYIETNVNNIKLKRSLKKINEFIINRELENLNIEQQTFIKPKDEATKKTSIALMFFESDDAKKLEDTLISELQKLNDKTVKEIIYLIELAIKNELFSKIDEMSKMAIAYSEDIARGRSHEVAIKSAKNRFSTIDYTSLKIDKNEKIDKNFVLKSMQSYVKTLFEDYIKKYLNVKIDLKKVFNEYKENTENIYRKVEEEFNSKLIEALDINIQNIERKEEIEIGSNISFNVSIPDSVLDYKYQKEEREDKSTSSWYKPWTWGDKENVKIQDEKHTLIINSLNLKNSIERTMKESVNHFENQEKENYKNAIIEEKEKYLDIFRNFLINKKENVNKLSDDIKKNNKKLEFIKKQILEFKNLIKE